MSVWPPKHQQEPSHQTQISDATGVGVSLRRTLRTVGRQQKKVQRLRATARDKNRDRNTTVTAFTVALSALIRLLQDANLSGELGQKISAYTGSITNHLKEVEELGIDIDDVQAALEPAERKLEDGEFELYELIYWPVHQGGSEIDPMDRVPATTSDEQEYSTAMSWRDDQSSEATTPTGQAGLQTREEGLMPLEFLHMETLEELSTHDKILEHSAEEEKEEDETGDTSDSVFDLGQAGEFPLYIESLIASPSASEDRPFSSAGGRLLRLWQRKSNMEDRLSKAYRDYIILQGEAQARLAVGVAPDDFSQEFLSSYPHTRCVLEEQLAKIESEMDTCNREIDFGRAQVVRVSQMYFHMDQFAEISLGHRPSELILDDEDRLEAPWEVFEALASDLWPVSSTIRYPKYAKSWMSMILAVLKTPIEFLDAYVSFWLLKCLQASWLSFSRFIYHHYLDDTFAPDYKLIKTRLLQSWFDTDLTVSLGRTREIPRRPLRAIMTITSIMNSDEMRRDVSDETTRDTVIGARLSGSTHGDGKTQPKWANLWEEGSLPQHTRSFASPQPRRWQSRNNQARGLSH